MTALTFVNTHGQPVYVPSTDDKAKAKPKAASKRPAAKRSDDAQKHMGWQVFGVTPESLEKAVTSHEAKAKKAAAAQKPIPPFDRDAWLNSATQKKARSKPYALRQAAQECADLLTKAGWLRVTVEEVIR